MKNIFYLSQLKSLTEGTHYDTNAAKKLADSGLFDLETSEKIVSGLKDTDIAAFNHSPNWLVKYLIGIIRMLIEYADGDREKAQQFLLESPSIFNEYLFYVKQIRPKLNSDSDRVKFDNKFNEQMSYEDVKAEIMNRKLYR